MRYPGRADVVVRASRRRWGVLASGAVGDAFHMDICPHDRLSSMRDEAVAGARAETDRGYVLYPRRR